MTSGNKMDNANENTFQQSQITSNSTMNLDCLFVIIEFLRGDNISLKFLCRTCKEWNQFIMHSDICDRLIWRAKLDREFGVDYWGLGTGERALVSENKWPFYSQPITENISDLMTQEYYEYYFCLDIGKQRSQQQPNLPTTRSVEDGQQRQASYKTQYSVLLFSSLVWLKLRSEWWTNYILVTGVKGSGKTHFIEQVLSPLLKSRDLKAHRIGSIYTFLKKDDEGFLLCESSSGIAKTPYFRGVKLSVIIFVFDNTRTYTDEDWTKASLAFHGMMGEYKGASPKCIVYSNGSVYSRESINEELGFAETNECYYYEHATTKYVEDQDHQTLWSRLSYLIQLDHDA